MPPASLSTLAVMKSRAEDGEEDDQPGFSSGASSWVWVSVLGLGGRSVSSE